MKKVIFLIKKNIPWKLKQIIKLLISIFREVPYPISDFPLTGSKKIFSIRSSFLDKALKFENDEFEYYSKIYNDPRSIDTDLAEADVFRTSIEILPGKMVKNFSLSIEDRSIFQISRPNLSPISIKIENKKDKNTFDLLSINNRFTSFFEEGGTNIEIKSKENFFVSEPITLDQKINHKKKNGAFPIC